MEKYIMMLTILADLFIGASRSKYHPAVLMGNFGERLSERLYNENDSPAKQKTMGMVFVCIVSTVIYAAATAMTIVLLTAGFWWYFVICIIIMAFMISPRNLAETAIEIKQHLAKGDIARARECIGGIAVCDTDKMDSQEAVRAVIEITARNIVHRAVAPLFYYFIGGLPMAVLYCAINTTDLRFDLKDERYVEFAAAIAKLHAVFNFIPAHLTALFLVMSAYILQYDGRKAVEIVRRDARKHYEMSCGYPTAAVAGALRIRLGGTSYYDGEPYFHEHIGDAVEQLGLQHIDKVVRLLYMTTILFCLLGTSITMAKQIGGIF